MAALVVTLSPPSDRELTGERIGIFPGGATPAVYAADTAFWIGYGFATDGADPEKRALDDDTRFELYVDGERVEMRTELEKGEEAPERKTDVADFAAGLPPGWHELVGRWYDGGKLILSSRASIEFVER